MLCFSSSGIPTLQSIIDSRDMLLYNYYIPVYTDYITSDIIRYIIDGEKKSRSDSFIKKNIVQLFNRDFLKPIWKTTYEYVKLYKKELLKIRKGS